MTIQPVTPDDIETFTIVTNPARSFSSSSSGLTGSVYVFARRSASEKEITPQPAFIDSIHNDANLSSLLDAVVNSTWQGTDISAGVSQYLSGVHAQQASVRKQKFLEVIRFTPPVTLTADSIRKTIIKDTLMPFYRNTSPSYNYAYTNYHTLNFFTASNVPSASVLLYPSLPETALKNFASGSYLPTGAFSFDFYINPRYTTDSPGDSFKAGTLFHLSSTYAVSLVTGSSRNINGFPDGFRLLLQLSQSADIQPSRALPGSYPNDLVFLSDDNSLRLNNWHHVVVRWGTNTVNNGTGSFVVDGITRGKFVVPSSSIAPAPFVSKSNPDVLCVGNFYEGTNTGNSSIAAFFAVNPALREGLVQLVGLTDTEEPTKYAFNHPLNAEVHDLLIRESYLTDDDIVSGSGVGPTDLSDALFYVPPFFTVDSPFRQFVGTYGGVLQTPFFAIDGQTADPFNTAMSFGVAGKYLNLENFTRDFANDVWPRALFLTASEISTTTSASAANDFLYNFPAVRKRNVTVLPCDDGNFSPNFDLLDSVASSSLKLIDDLGSYDNSIISLKEMVPVSSLIQSLPYDSGSLFDKLAGPSPENIGLEPGEVLTIFQRTADPSSNEVVLFDVSNLFYGNRIKPGTLVLSDTALSATGGKIGITLKDNGLGSIYRADCVTSQSTWNCVGNVFYDEGLIIIKSPELPFFGNDQFDISFKGEQNIHTFRVNVLARANTLNSSSNVSFLPISASLAANIEDQSFVYITNVSLHDDNLNVVMKTQLAQPLLKRHAERYLLKLKMDF